MLTFENEKEGSIFSEAQRAENWGPMGQKLRTIGLKWGWSSWGRGGESPPHQLEGLGEHCKLYFKCSGWLFLLYFWQCARQWTLPNGRERGRECRATIIACIILSLDGHLPDNLTCNPTTLHNGTLFVFMPITAIKWKGQTLVKRVTWIFTFVTVDILRGHIEHFAPRHAEMRLQTPDFTLAPYGDHWFLQTLQIWCPFSTCEFSKIWWQFAYFRVTGFSASRTHLCWCVSIRSMCAPTLSQSLEKWELLRPETTFPIAHNGNHWYTRMSKMVGLYKFCGHASVTVRFVWSMGILA